MTVTRPAHTPVPISSFVRVDTASSSTRFAPGKLLSRRGDTDGGRPSFEEGVGETDAVVRRCCCARARAVCTDCVGRREDCGRRRSLCCLPCVAPGEGRLVRLPPCGPGSSGRGLNPLPSAASSADSFGGADVVLVGASGGVIVEDGDGTPNPPSGGVPVALAALALALPMAAVDGGRGGSVSPSPRLLGIGGEPWGMRDGASVAAAEEGFADEGLAEEGPLNDDGPLPPAAVAAACAFIRSGEGDCPLCFVIGGLATVTMGTTLLSL